MSRRIYYLRARPNYDIMFKSTDVLREISQCVFGANGVRVRSKDRAARDFAGVVGVVMVRYFCYLSILMRFPLFRHTAVTPSEKTDQNIILTLRRTNGMIFH